jgi:hypothetical protein
MNGRLFEVADNLIYVWFSQQQGQVKADVNDIKQT